MQTHCGATQGYLCEEVKNVENSVSYEKEKETKSQGKSVFLLPVDPLGHGLT